MGLYEQIAEHPEIRKLIDGLETETHKALNSRFCVADLSSIYGVAGRINGQTHTRFFQKEPTERTQDLEIKLQEYCRELARPFVIYMNTAQPKQEHPPTEEDFQEHYYCFATIEDNMQQKGKWVVEGYDSNKREFSKIMEEKEMEDFQTKMLGYDIPEALFHEIGTHTYTLVRQAVRVNDARGKTLLIRSKKHELAMCEAGTKKIELEGTGLMPDCA